MDVLKHRKNERIGRLNRRVQLHYATETVNTYGERVEAWTSLGTFWAGIQYRTLASKETPEAGQETAIQKVEITIRKNALLDENWRVYHDGRLYEIETVSESTDRALQVLGCRQIQAATLSTAEGGFPVGGLAFTETFTGTASDRVTVTVYGGLVPTDKARVFVFLNGQFISQYTIQGAAIVFTGFTIEATDTVVVTFFI